MRWFGRSSHSASPFSDPTSSGTIRAKRHRIRVPVQYRQPGQAGWSNAVTTNLSCTGALLEDTALSLHVGDELELRLTAPPALTGEATVLVFCTARVVRIESAQPARIAAAILRYRLEPPTTNVGSAEPLRSLSHEMNNLLTAIAGRAELLLLTEQEVFDRAQLEAIKKAAMTAARVLQRMQEVA
jgi:signal transduction histidine kinase